MQLTTQIAVQAAELKDKETLILIKTNAKDFETLELVVNQVAKKVGDGFSSGMDEACDDNYYIFEAREQGTTIFTPTGILEAVKTALTGASYEELTKIRKHLDILQLNRYF